jgi:hypothetical protein
MNKDRDLLIALSEAVILLLDHAVHRPSLDRHNLIRTRLNNQVQAAKQRKTGRL